MSPANVCALTGLASVTELSAKVPSTGLATINFADFGVPPTHKQL